MHAKNSKIKQTNISTNMGCVFQHGGLRNENLLIASVGFSNLQPVEK